MRLLYIAYAFSEKFIIAVSFVAVGFKHLEFLISGVFGINFYSHLFLPPAIFASIYFSITRDIFQRGIIAPAFLYLSIIFLPAALLSACEQSMLWERILAA